MSTSPSGLRFLFLLLLLVATGCGEVRLYSNLPEQEVNEMVAILRRSGIECSKLEGDEGKWHVAVGEERYADAVSILSEAGRPRKQRPTIEELFPKSGFTSSPAEQRIRLTYGLEQSLESTIAALPGGVIDARVHLVLPDNQPLRGSAKPSRANVVVVHRKGADIQNAVATIPQIVMGAVDGLDPDSVSVELVETEDSPLTMETLPAGPPEVEYADILSIKVSRDSLPKFLAILALAGLLIVFVLAMGALRLLRPVKAAN
jgi:type III secretion protein J